MPVFVVIVLVALVAGLFVARLIPRPVLMVLMTMIGALLALVVGLHYHAIR